MSDTLVKVKDLVQAVVSASEKAACIARACRGEKELFQLLVEEKKECEKNPRFVQDFKTLADVLVQETIKHDLGSLFPALKGHIHGEESNKFTNGVGDTVVVEILSTPQETAALLTQVLNGNASAAQLLSFAAHLDKAVRIDIGTEATIDTSSLGIWIDPIDSTSEYIAGMWEMEDESGVATSGLQCVCVLIGAYRLTDGVPVLGVINQPFRYKRGPETYEGQFYWSISADDQTVFTSKKLLLPKQPRHRPVVLASTSESPAVLEALQPDCVVKLAAGAGYKLLCVAQGLVDAYVVSKGTTFRWDTCAPHACLRGIGGGVSMLQRAVDNHKRSIQCKDASKVEICYNVAEGTPDGVLQWCNSLGLIAYRDPRVLEKIVDLLSKGNCCDK